MSVERGRFGYWGSRTKTKLAWPDRTHEWCRKARSGPADQDPQVE
jgi:hypothetical protein